MHQQALYRLLMGSLVGFTMALVWLLPGTTSAQEQTTCPILFVESAQAAEILCEGLGAGEICLGNGSVEIQAAAGASPSFAAPGDIVPLTNLQSLSLSSVSAPDSIWTTLIARPNLPTSDGGSTTASMILLGDATLTNAFIPDAGNAASSSGTASATIRAAGGLNVRQAPNTEAGVVWQLANEEEVTAIGRSADSQWVRIIIPSDFGGPGWVFAPFVEVSGGIEVLPFASTDDPLPQETTASFGPMQTVTFSSQPVPETCSGIADSGMILQSPDGLGAQVLMQINGATLQFNGTVYVRAQAGRNLTVSALEGEATLITGDDIQIPISAGFESVVPLDEALQIAGPPDPPAPYDANQLVLLPLQLAPRAFNLADPNQTLGEASAPTLSAEQTFATATPLPTLAPTTVAVQPTVPPPTPLPATPIPTQAPVTAEATSVAQASPQAATCPTLFIESAQAAEILCEGTGEGQLCYGNGTVQTTPADGAAPTFATPGDIAPLTDFASVRLQSATAPDGVWTTLIANPILPTTNDNEAAATMLLFGDLTLTNAASASGTTATVTANGVNVLNQPNAASAVVFQLQANATVQVVGRSADNQWARIIIPNDFAAPGWIFAPALSVAGGLEALPVHDNDTPVETTPSEFGPMQRFTLSSQPIPDDCQGVVASGIVLQAPASLATGEALRVAINGAVIRFAGSIYVTAQPGLNLTVASLEGESAIITEGVEIPVPAGFEVATPIDDQLQVVGFPDPPAPYSARELIRLPLQLAPRVFTLTDINNELAQDQTDTSISQATPEPTPVVQQPATQQPTVNPTQAPAQPTQVVASDATCPQLFLESAQATEFLCEGLAEGNVCVGNGVVEANAAPNATASLAAPGDVSAYADLASLRLLSLDAPDGNWTTVVARPTLPTTTGGESVSTLLLIGDLTLRNAAEQASGPAGVATATVIAENGANIRGEPNTDAGILTALQAGDTANAIGRSEDNQWVRIIIPNAFARPGWVFAPALDVAGGLSALPVAAVNDPAPEVSAPDFDRMQSVTLSSRPTDPACTGIADSGLVLQAPATLPGAARVRFEVNGVTIETAGTVFVQAQPNLNMTVNSLEGTANLITGENDAITLALEPGFETTIPIDTDLQVAGPPDPATPYNADELILLPLQLTPRVVTVADVNDDLADNQAVTLGETGTTDATVSTTSCNLSVSGGNKNLRGGPGLDYNVVGTALDGATLTATGQALDRIRLTWYETTQGWIRSDIVGAAPICADLPTVDAPPLPAVADANTGATDGTTDGSTTNGAAAPTAVPPPTPVPAAGTSTLRSTNVGELCNAQPITFTQSVPQETYGVTVGGIWEATVGTTIRVTVEGSTLREAFDDYVRLFDGNTLIAASGNSRTLQYSFAQQRNFEITLTVRRNDNITVTVDCVG